MIVYFTKICYNKCNKKGGTLMKDLKVDKVINKIKKFKEKYPIMSFYIIGNFIKIHYNHLESHSLLSP